MSHTCNAKKKKNDSIFVLFEFLPALVAQLDASPTGDQDAGSIPAMSGNILL